MKVARINFEDEEFRKLFSLYYLKSFPYGRVDSMKSISSRLNESKHLLDILKGSDLSIGTKDSKHQNFFTFFSKNNDSLNLKFAFPNLHIKLTPRGVGLNFYKLLLYAYDFFSVSEIYGDIERVHKKNSYKKWLIRHLNCEYKEKTNEEFDKVFFYKEGVLKHYEELQAKSNRDESGDQKS